MQPPSTALSLEEKLAKIQKYLPGRLARKILTQKDRIEGECRQITVLFCDMEGYTSLSEQVGHEEIYAPMDQVYEILIRKVHDYGGTVNKLTGDGILALFGAPFALEDAPQRAIHASLAIHREIGRLGESLREEKGLPPIRMRAGIHTGPVVVGTVGNDVRVEFTALGETVNLASRVEGLAKPGTTCVTASTFKFSEAFFVFEDCGHKKVKGMTTPVKIYKVIGPGIRRTRFDMSIDRGLTPFVGRERELELLLDGLERAKEFQGQAVSIVAEAGMGKSRLLYEFKKSVAAEAVNFMEEKCLSHSKGEAYHPILELLKTNLDIGAGNGSNRIKEKVRKSLESMGAMGDFAFPCLLELLSVKDSGIDKISMSPEARKSRTIEALKQVIFKGSENGPLVLIIEDLHWVDKSTEDVLKSLLEGIPGRRVLSIFTYRPDFVHAWGSKSYHSQVTLNRLSNRESLIMASHLLGVEKVNK